MSRKKIVQIQPPVLEDAKKLSALELNSYHFDKKHTVLTPAVLDSQGNQTQKK